MSVSRVFREGESLLVNLALHHAHHLKHRHRRVHEDPPIPLLPNAPYDVDYGAAGPPLLVFREVLNEMKPLSVKISICHGGGSS